MKKKLCVILMLTVLCVTLACGINTVFAEETGEAATLVSVTDAETRGVYVEETETALSPLPRETISRWE